MATTAPFERGFVPPERTKLHPAATNWLEMTELLLQGSRGGPRVTPSEDGEQAAKTRQYATLAWTMMREARIYAIPPKVYEDLHAIALARSCAQWAVNEKRITPEQLGRFAEDKKGSLDTLFASTDDLEAYHTWAATRPHERPDFVLPFKAVYLAYERGVTLSLSQLRERWSTSMVRRMQRVALAGHLLARTGCEGHDDSTVTAFELLVARRDDGSGIMIEPVTHAGLWVRNSALHAELLPTLVAGIVERKISASTEVPGFAREVRHARKALGLRGVAKPIPPPFYVVNITAEELTRERRPSEPKGTPGGWTLDHRIDVAGHWRILVVRGEGELGVAEVEALGKRGYRLYRSASEVEGDMRSMLVRRGFSMPGEGRWLAVRRTWVREHQRGPEGTPYIPAVRAT